MSWLSEFTGSILNVLTGGLFSSFTGAADAAQQAGTGVATATAAIAQVVNQLGQDMSSFINEMKELLTIKRYTPRGPNDMWAEEVERLHALQALRADLVVELDGKEHLPMPHPSHWIIGFAPTEE